MLQLLSLARFVEVASNSVCLLQTKPQLSVVVKATDPFKWAPTSMSNRYKVFHILHIFSGFAYVSVLTTLPLFLSAKLVGVAESSSSSSTYLLKIRPHCRVFVEGMLSLQWNPKSMSTHNRCFVSFIFCGCAYVSVLTMYVDAALIGKACGSCLHFCLPPLDKPRRIVVVEGMLPL